MSRSATEPQFGNRERDFVLGVVTKLLRDRDQAEDATQDAMLLAFRHRGTFRGESKFTTWLYRIAHTTALMHLRKQRSTLARELQQVDAKGYESVLAPGLDPEDRLIVAEDVALAARGLAIVGRRYDRIATMRFAEGLSVSEIGAKLGLKEATVKSRIHRGRAAMRTAIRRRAADLETPAG